MTVLRAWIARRPAPIRPHRRVRRAAALAASIASLASCSDTPTKPIAGAVTVHLRDFAIDLSRSQVRSGRIVIDLANLGPTTHEFNLDRTALGPADLPRKTDGLTVEEDSPLLHRITSIEGVPLGSHRRISVSLKPGHYVVYCNLEGHYLGAMYAEILVTAAGASS